jgi:hypothetical protein
MKAVVTFAVALSLVCSSALAANTTSKNSQTSKSQKSAAWQNTATMPTATTTQTGNTTQNSKTSSTGNWSAQKFMRVSQDGYNAMHAIRAARVAIFSGQPNVAASLLNKATTNLQNAAKDAPTFVMTTQTAVNGNVVANDTAAVNMNWVPIEGQFSLADTLVASPQKSQCIEKANRHFQNGQTKQAVEQLHLASIDVSCTRVWMSLATTTNYVNQATKLLNERKYYQANLVLKAAEDGLVVDSTNLSATPNDNNTNTSGNANTNNGYSTKVNKATNGKTSRVSNVNAKSRNSSRTAGYGNLNANSTVKTSTGSNTNAGNNTNTGSPTSTSVKTNNGGQKNEVN